MITIADQLSNSVSLSSPPKRIISIVPSQTELLYDLGLEKEVVGITKYCVHPKDWKDSKTIVGGTKKLNLEKIRELKPDLIIGNKEENEKSQILELMKEYPVWTSDIKTLEEALKMIESIGEVTGKQKRAAEIQNNIREQLSHFKLQAMNLKFPARNVLYLIWRRPYICAGANTFIDHMLQICGLTNAASPLAPLLKERGDSLEAIGVRYPEITPEEIRKANPFLIFLSSEPYPFRQKHIQELQIICPNAKVVLVNGEMFSWYGSRLLYAPSYFERLLQNL